MRKTATFLLAICFTILTITIFLFFYGSNQRESDIFDRLHSLQDGSNIRIKHQSGRVFSMEVARTPQAQAKGLSGRTNLEINSGMIFIFDDKGQRTFWMKETYIPLDIIFLDDELEVINYFANATPDNTNITYPSAEASRYVIELNGGISDTLDLKIGDKFTLTE